MNEVFALVVFLLLVELLISRMKGEQAILDAPHASGSSPATGEAAASSQPSHP
jgi:hypothetical protein